MDFQGQHGGENEFWTFFMVLLGLFTRQGLGCSNAPAGYQTREEVGSPRAYYINTASTVSGAFQTIHGKSFKSTNQDDFIGCL